MRLSIIIPALNEAANIVATLMPLQAMRQRGVEVLLVDGGSTDKTCELAAPWVDCVIGSESGRAQQMNAGADAASGDALLFLHADSILPADGDEWIGKALTDPRFRWGRFDVAISGAHFMLPVIAWFMNRRSRLTGIATGDQGIFVARDAFASIGGFPNQPLMEDVAICVRLLAQWPRPVYLDKKIVTSGRRWEKQGVWRTIMLMWHLRLQYFMGASPDEIHRAYYGK